jgi:hypothetical protein
MVFDNTLAVDGVPIIDKSKQGKLLAKISKEFTRKEVSIKTNDIMGWMTLRGPIAGCAVCCRLCVAECVAGGALRFVGAVPMNWLPRVAA